MGDSLVVDWVCRSYVMTIQEFNTQDDLILLGIVGFDVILGLD